MRFGLLCSAQAGNDELGAETGQGFRDYFDFNAEAEALGYHSTFSVEHHFTGWNQVSATLTLLTGLAMRTTTLRLGTAVTVLPWHNPVLLAEQAATLDLISGGRFDFGIGKGYRHNEFKGFNIRPEEAEERFEEAIDVILRSWTSRTPFSHRGRYWRFEDIVVEPPPAQRPHPPLCVAAGSASSIRRAARRGFNLILDQYAGPEAIGERIALYRSEREAMGWTFDPMQVTVARQLYISKDEADKVAALARQAEYTQRTVAVSVQELGSPTRVLVMKSSLRAVWAPPGYLLFVREGTLFAQRMDPKTFQLEGEPLSVAQDVTNNEGLGRAAFAVSQNGVLVYRGGLFSRIKQLAWFDRDGKRLGVLGQPGQYWSVALSPDEKNAAVVAGPRGRSDLWMMDLTSGFFRRMTLEQNASGYIGPWSPDSQRIAVNMLSGGIQELEVASGKINALTPDTFTAADWSPDGRSLLCIEIGRSRLSVLPLGGATKPQIVQDARYATRGFRFSPDGQFVAYASQQSGTLEVFVASFPSFGVKRQISSGGGDVPRWTKDGRELFFREPPGTLMSAEIRTGPKIEATVPRRLFPYGDNSSSPISNQFGVTSDGKRFLILEPVQKTGPSAEIMVVLNWAAELKQP